jgi:hypothetical protein
MVAAAFGKLVLEQRRGNAIITGGMAALGACLTLYGSYYLAITFNDEQNGFSNRSVLIVPGLLLFVFGAWGFINRVRIYERGAEQRTFFGTRALAFEEVESLTYSSARLLVSGIEAGTRIWVTLRPARGRGIVFDLTVRHRSEPMERLRDQLAGLIASRYLDLIRRGQPVIWSKHVTLRPEGISYRPARLIGRGAEALLPYAKAGHGRFEGGRFAVLDGEKAVISIACGAENFYPGLFALRQLVGTS